MNHVSRRCACRSFQLQLAFFRASPAATACTRDAVRIGLRPAARLGFLSTSTRHGQRGLDEHEQEAHARQNQARRPWLRDKADKAPADSQDSEVGPANGKLLTTPTRLLKLILPLPIRVEKDTGNNGRDYRRALSTNQDVQPLALLVHPQQPLSYVERLIQAEVPPVVEAGKEKLPNVYFRAEDTTDRDDAPVSEREARNRDSTQQRSMSGDDGSPRNVASYSGLGREGPERRQKDKKWVRWSSSTEMGDFIRDAARGREFAVEIEGYGVEMRVDVPSFNDRTYYLRTRLRRMSREIDHLSRIKNECDLLAHRSAHRLAKGGFGLLATWWGVVYYVSFHTEFGWDLVEPVTYLAGLTTIMAGYLWFLYISRDLSYKAAMNVTVSRRQHALYEAKGFDLHRWEHLVAEAKALRNEIATVATEYDVDWDESRDMSDDVVEVLDKAEQDKGDRTKAGDDEPEEVKTEKKERRERRERRERKEATGRT